MGTHHHTRRDLSNEYQHDRVWMVFKNLCILVIWTKVARPDATPNTDSVLALYITQPRHTPDLLLHLGGSPQVISPILKLFHFLIKLLVAYLANTK